jgi:Uma2 family endonuclease
MTALSHGGFRAWVKSPGFPEHAHPTFLGGDTWLEMSPESLETHNKVKGEFTSALVRLVRDRELGEAYSDGAFLSNTKARISTEPDFLFVSWAAFRSGRVRLTQRQSRGDDFIEIVGTPDLVLEIVSDSSARKDLVRLKRAYLRAAIPEYWLVDARGADLSFQIFRRQGGDYQPSAPDFEAQTSGVLGARFTLSRSRNRLGRFTHKLAVRRRN